MKNTIFFDKIYIWLKKIHKYNNEPKNLQILSYLILTPNFVFSDFSFLQCPVLHETFFFRDCPLKSNSYEDHIWFEILLASLSLYLHYLLLSCIRLVSVLYDQTIKFDNVLVALLERYLSVNFLFSTTGWSAREGRVGRNGWDVVDPIREPIALIAVEVAVCTDEFSWLDFFKKFVVTVSILFFYSILITHRCEDDI